jgi:CheY-like chemotaxis protein/anti-sigma regulatory factor (Ser/Thr protein kinase)
LVNLLSNAVKFTPEGGSVGLKIHPDENRDFIYFTVWDTGIGIAPEDRSRLFQSFVQIDSQLARRYEGTGLGLSLVKRLTELHGGTVGVESTPGQGSRFFTKLPLRIEASAPQPSKTLEAGTQAARFTRSPLVLVAEDNLASIKLVSTLLERAGCRIIHANTGLQAVDLALRRLPDVILMDVQMPELDGIEATRRITADPRTGHIPIICVTALAMPQDRERCLEAGARGYVSKPYDMQTLLQTMARLLPEISA